MLCDKIHKPLTCYNPESINHQTVAVSQFHLRRKKQWRRQIMRELNEVVQNEEFSFHLYNNRSNAFSKYIRKPAMKQP